MANNPRVARADKILGVPVADIRRAGGAKKLREQLYDTYGVGRVMCATYINRLIRGSDKG